MTILNADELNKIAQSTGYTPTGGGFSSVGLPTVPTTLNSENTKPSSSPVILTNTDMTNHSGIIAGANAYTNPNPQDITTGPDGTPAATPSPTTPTPSTTPFKDAYTASLDAVKSFLGQDTGKEQYQQSQQDVQAQNLGYTDYNALVQAKANLSKRSQALSFESQAIPLKLQEDATGRGITTGGLAPIQAGELRKNAIQALGIQSQYALLSGDLQTAQDTAQRAVDLKYKDIESEIDKQTKLLTLYAPLMTAEEKKQADALTLANEAKKTELADKKKQQQDIINSFQQSGQANYASEALQLDPNSTTFTQDLSKLQAKLVPASGIAQEYNYAVANGYKGTFEQYQNEDANRKAKIAAAGVALPPGSQDLNNAQTVKDLSTINNINNVLASSDFDSAFGIKGKVNQYIPGSPAQKVIADVQQIKDILSLAARGQLKGQGQISDFEGKMLSNAQTALNSNLSADDARQALKNVKGAITTSSGGQANVAITDPKTGQTKIGQANSAMITEAIANGFRVTYQ